MMPRTDGTDIYRISFYDAFACTMGACKETCCKAWSIPVDDRAYARFRKEKGATGLLLRIAVRKREDMRLLNAGRGKCIFHTRDGLCSLQKKKGASFPPYACRVFPRRRVNLGMFAEETLDLSCPEAARLFLTHGVSGGMVKTTGQVRYARSGNNDDTAFLTGLMRSREYLTEVLAGSGKKIPRGEAFLRETGDRFRYALALAMRWQEVSARGKNPFEAGGPEPEGKREEPETLFPLPIGLLNDWMNGCLYSDDLRFRLPLLRKLCRCYMKRFDKLTGTQGQLRLEAMLKSYVSSPFCDGASYGAYAAYYLFRYYSGVYEDYSFARYVRCALMHANMLLLLDALWFDETGELDTETRTGIIAVYEKRVLHNAGMEKKMMGMWNLEPSYAEA